MQFDELTISSVKGTIKLSGSGRIMPGQSAKIVEFLLRNPLTTLDISELDFANSSLINVFSQIAIALRDNGAIRIKGNSDYIWQLRVGKNLKRLNPNIILDGIL